MHDDGAAPHCVTPASATRPPARDEEHGEGTYMKRTRERDFFRERERGHAGDDGRDRETGADDGDGKIADVWARANARDRAETCGRARRRGGACEGMGRCTGNWCIRWCARRREGRRVRGERAEDVGFHVG